MATVERVEAAMETELSRLGSEKLLLAVTGADIRDATVAGALAATLDVGADCCEAWAAETGDAGVAAALADAAELYADLRATTLDAWPDAASEADPLVEPADPGDEPGRVGAGLVGLPLVLDRLLLQAVSYQVNEADTAAADRLRGFRETVGTISVSAEGTLGVEADEGAVEAAVAVVEAAYERYADRLEDMGLDPKPLC